VDCASNDMCIGQSTWQDLCLVVRVSCARCLTFANHCGYPVKQKKIKVHLYVRNIIYTFMNIP
jgi:hypothetical protein